MKHFFLLWILTFFVIWSLYAQEDHYWSQQFGAGSTLMGGAMIAGVRDNSAVFYNPGALAYIQYSNLSVDANIYKLDKIKIGNGAGSGLNLNSAQMNIYPQIISGMINYIKVPRLKISYSILTRNFANVLMSTRYTKENTGNEGQGRSKFLGEFDFVNQLNEQWFGITTSYLLKNNLGIGVSLFGYYRGQTSGITSNSLETSSVDSTNSLTITKNSESTKFMTVGAIIKFGLAYETGNWKFGLTLTTPSIGFYGNGSVKREESFYSTSAQGTDVINPYMIYAENRSTRARYHHPVAIGAGIEFRTTTTRIAISGEYYSKIDPYDNLSPSCDPFLFPSSIVDSAASQDKLEHYLYIGDAAVPVFNLGFGFAQTLWKQLDLILGAHTDYTSYKPTSDSKVSIHGTSTWDLYYISTGVSYHRPKHSITLGFTYGFSPVKNIEPIAIVNPGTPPETMANVFSQLFSVVLGYTYYFPR